MPSIAIPSKDKYAHFIFYFVLTLSWMLSFKEVNNKILFKIIGIIIAYGIIIEVVQQNFTANREADVFDVIANSLGAIFAYFAFLFSKKKILKK